MLHSVNLGGGGVAAYQYDAAKQRTRKRVTNQNGFGGSWERISLGGYELYRRTENEAGIAYSYDLENGPEGLTLVYKAPALIMNLPVEFEIKDIELP